MPFLGFTALAMSTFAQNKLELTAKMPELVDGDVVYLWNPVDKTTDSTYVKNKLNGERIQHYENGQVYKRENFIKGNFYGTQEYFTDNGDKLYSAEYISDDFHGDFKIYEKGKLVKTKKYDSDELAAIE